MTTIASIARDLEKLGEGDYLTPTEAYVRGVPFTGSPRLRAWISETVERSQNRPFKGYEECEAERKAYDAKHGTKTNLQDYR